MDVKLKINGNCQLVAVPLVSPLNRILYPCLDDTKETMFVDFVYNTKTDINSTIKVSEDIEHYSYDLPDDGLYIYYRVKIFDKEFADENYQGLCYDKEKNKLIFQGGELIDILEIIPYLDQGDSVLDYVRIPVFSICRLQQCLKELQKRSLVDCNKGLCDKFDSERQIRDFLFISIYVLENLICEERYAEATSILESLTSCVPICKNLGPGKSGCNCG